MREVVREQVVIDRPLPVVWRHLTQLEEWPSWAGHIRRVDPTPRGELTAATRAVLHMRAGPRPTMVVTEYEPPQRWVWEGRSFGTVTRFEHRLEQAAEGRTRVWFLAWLAGPLARPGGWVFGRMMHRYLARALPTLKAEVERS